jgi:uncharacterized coiled-coil protein SlyX
MLIHNAIGKYRLEGRSWFERDVADITKITVHHTASKQVLGETHKSILNKHMKAHTNRDWPGLSYHYMIVPDGVIYQINDHKEVTWHDGKNWESLGVCLDGYFHPDFNEKPTPEQLNSLKELLDHLCTEHPEFPADYDDVRGHRETMATACPGDLLFPYVVEYRQKLGNVDWGSEPITDVFNPSKAFPPNWYEINEAQGAIDRDLISLGDSWDSTLKKFIQRDTNYLNLIEKQKQEIDNLILEVNRQTKTITEQEDSISTLSKRVAELENTLTDPQKRIEALEARLAETTKEISRLYEENKMLKDNFFIRLFNIFRR